jgi:hypothetical protein
MAEAQAIQSEILVRTVQTVVDIFAANLRRFLLLLRTRNGSKMEAAIISDRLPIWRFSTGVRRADKMLLGMIVKVKIQTNMPCARSSPIKN